MFGNGRGSLPNGARLFMESAFLSANPGGVIPVPSSSTGSSILSGLNAFGDDSTQLSALHQLNELLLMGQSNRVSQFIQPLIQIVHQHSSIPELALFSIRALNQIVDIEPGSTAQLVSSGLIPALCAKLLDISDTEVAEQCIKNLQILSQNHSKELLRQGALKSCLTFFDFFPNHLQRVASITAANVAKDISRCTYDDIGQIIDFLPILNQCLTSVNDEQALQNLCICYSRLVSGLTQQINLNEQGLKKSFGTRNPISQRTQSTLQKFVNKTEAIAYSIEQEKELNVKIPPNDKNLEINEIKIDKRGLKKKRSSSHQFHGDFDGEINDENDEIDKDQKDNPDSAKDIFLDCTMDMKNWRVRLLRKVGSEPTLLFLLNLARRTLQNNSDSNQDGGKPGIDHSIASNILSSIARILRVSPQFVPVVINHGILDLVQFQLDELSANDSALLIHQHEAKVADSLRLCQALLPQPPSSTDFSSNGPLGDSESLAKFEASLIIVPGSNEIVESSNTDIVDSNVINKEESQPPVLLSTTAASMESELDELILINESGEKVWACPQCTFHNPLNAPACDICGEMSPVVKARVNANKTSSKDNSKKDIKIADELHSIQEKLPLDESSPSIEEVVKNNPAILESLSKAILGHLMKIISSSSSKDLQSRSLSIVSSLLFRSPKELLIKTYRDYLAPGKVHHHSALYSCLKPGSNNPEVVASAVRMIMILLWRLSDTSDVNILYDLLRDGIIPMIDSLSSRFDLESSKKYHYSNSEKIESLSRRVSLLKKRIESLDEKIKKDTEDIIKRRMFKLGELANRLNKYSIKNDIIIQCDDSNENISKSDDYFNRENDDFSPALKKVRLGMDKSEENKIFEQSGKDEDEITAISELCDMIISNDGITVNELIESGLISSLHKFLFKEKSKVTSSCSLNKTSNKRGASCEKSNIDEKIYDTNIYRYFKSAASSSVSPASLTENDIIAQKRGRALVEKIHEVFNSSESLKILQHGSSPSDSIRYIDSPIQVFVKPSNAALDPISKMIFTQNKSKDYKIKPQDYHQPVLVEPLNSIESLENFIWNKLQAQILQSQNQQSSKYEAATKYKTKPIPSTEDISQSDEMNFLSSTSSLAPSPSKDYFKYMDSYITENDSETVNISSQPTYMNFSKSSDPINDIRREIIQMLKSSHLTIGIRVTRGLDWKYKDQDGGPGSIGKVIGFKPWSKYDIDISPQPSSSLSEIGVIVEWEGLDVKINKNIYRWNVLDCFDIIPAPSIEKHDSSSGNTLYTTSTTIPSRRYGFYGGEGSSGFESWRSSLTEGSILDVLDINLNWRRGIILKISYSQNQNQIKKRTGGMFTKGSSSQTPFAFFAFEGLEATHYEWVPLQSQRISRAHSHVPPTPGSYVFDSNGLSIIQSDYLRFNNNKQQQQQTNNIGAAYPYQHVLKLSDSSSLIVSAGSIVDYLSQLTGKWEQGKVDHLEFIPVSTTTSNNSISKSDTKITTSIPPGAPILGKRGFASIEGLRKKKVGISQALKGDEEENKTKLSRFVVKNIDNNSDQIVIDIDQTNQLANITRVGMHENTFQAIEKEGIIIMNEIIETYNSSSLLSLSSIDNSKIYEKGTKVYVTFNLAKCPIWFRAVINEFVSDLEISVTVEVDDSTTNKNIVRVVSAKQLCLSIDQGKYSPSNQEIREFGYALRELDDNGIANLHSYLNIYRGNGGGGWSSINPYYSSRLAEDIADDDDAYDGYDGENNAHDEHNEGQEINNNGEDDDEHQNAEEEDENRGNDEVNIENQVQKELQKEEERYISSIPAASRNIEMFHEEMEWSKKSSTNEKDEIKQSINQDGLTQSYLQNIFATAQVPLLARDFSSLGESSQKHLSGNNDESTFYQFLLRRGTQPNEARAIAEQMDLISSNQIEQLSSSSAAPSSSIGRIAAFFRSSSSSSNNNNNEAGISSTSSTTKKTQKIETLSSEDIEKVIGTPVKLRFYFKNQNEKNKNQTIIKALQGISQNEDENLWSDIQVIEYDIDTQHPEWSRVASNGRLIALSGSFAKLVDGTISVESRFPTVSALNVKLKSGSWYYEIKLVRAGLAQVGWGDAQFIPMDENGKGCGDDAHSWAYDGHRTKKWHDGSTLWGSVWKDGDIIGCAVSIEENENDSSLNATMNFSINNDWKTPMGTAFSNVPISEYLTPAISFNGTFQAKVVFGSLQLGGNLQYPPPEGHLPISEWVNQNLPSSDKIDESLITSLIPSLNEESETKTSAYETRIDNSIGNETSKMALDILQLLGKKSNQVLLGLKEKDFISERLTERFSQQMQNLFALCADILPSWCRDISEHYRCCVPFNVRLDYFRTTSFGPSRSLQIILDPTGNGTNLTRSRNTPSRSHDPISNIISALGRSGASSSSMLAIKKQKVIVPRDRALESAVVLFHHIATKMPKPMLSVEFLHETGHGLGPTLEFFSLICLELQRADLGLWRWNKCILSTNEDCSGIIRSMSRISRSQILQVEQDQKNLNEQESRDDNTMETEVEGTNIISSSSSSSENSNAKSDNGQKEYIFNPLGLFPSIVIKETLSKEVYDGVLIYFQFFGRFIAKAFMDGRLLDLPLSLPLCKALLDQDLDINDISNIDSELGKSINSLSLLCESYDQSNDEEVKSKIEKDVDDLCLDFTFPGTSGMIKLCENGSNMIVSIHNLREYLDKVISMIFVDGVQKQLNFIKLGFNEIFPIEKLKVFSSSELLTLLSGSQQESWDRDTISKYIVCQKYTLQSPQIQTLITIMTEFNDEERKLFLKFCTGAPRLPIGGWQKLQPPLTVTRKDPVGDTKINDMLPSCSTCQVYLKLPEYTCGRIDIMKQKLLYAIHEGQSHFDFD